MDAGDRPSSNSRFSSLRKIKYSRRSDTTPDHALTAENTDHTGQKRRPTSGTPQDPLVPPAGIFRREALDQRGGPGTERRSAAAVWVGPFPGDQAAVPSQHGAWCDQPMCPQVPGQQPDQRGEHGTISPVQSGLGVGAASTATSWRKTSSSTFFDAADRPSNHSHPRTRTKIRYSRRNDTVHDHRGRPGHLVHPGQGYGRLLEPDRPPPLHPDLRGHPVRNLLHQSPPPGPHTTACHPQPTPRATTTTCRATNH